MDFEIGRKAKLTAEGAKERGGRSDRERRGDEAKEGNLIRDAGEGSKHCGMRSAGRTEIRDAFHRVPVREALALRLLQIYEEDLRQPERVTSPEGRIALVSSRTQAGHADHFWSLALAVDASQSQPEPYVHVVRGGWGRPMLQIDRRRLQL